MVAGERLRVGALLASLGADAARISVAADARTAEEVGFDSLWVSDHVLMPAELTTPYPFSDDGAILWELDDPWFDPLIWLTAAAVSTSRIELGTNVLVAALRPPLPLAKQLATIDQLAGGRLSVGVGAGWLMEEFEALGVPTRARGDRLDELLELLRAAWTGAVGPHRGAHYRVPRAAITRPVPAHDIPFYVGGTSRRALDRIARHGAGWIAEFPPAVDDPAAEIERHLRHVRARMEDAGRSADPVRVIYNANEPVDELCDRLDRLVAAGVTDVVLSVDLSDPGAAADALARVRRR